LKKLKDENAPQKRSKSKEEERNLINEGVEMKTLEPPIVVKNPTVPVLQQNPQFPNQNQQPPVQNPRFQNQSYQYAPQQQPQVYPPPQQVPLPKGWTSRTHNGRLFYCNHVAKKTTYTAPTEPALPDYIDLRFDKNGKAYFVNHKTKSTSYDYSTIK